MKRLTTILSRCVLLLALVLAMPHKSKAQEGTISFQTFYDELQPYGTWIDDPQYGTVWVPDVDQDFQPYSTNGHWALTDYGNTWVSDYEWGWAPFHYGRWRYDDYYGWEWIPGYDWAPAWVTWREGDGYYGWAPLTPDVDIDAAFNYNAPDFYWTFAPEAYITSPNIYNYYIPRTRIGVIINHTNFIRNRYDNGGRRWIFGPRQQDIQRITHRPVQVFHIHDADRPGRTVFGNNMVNIFRPNIERNNNNIRPNRIVDAAAYRNAHPTDRIAQPGTGRINYQNAQRLSQTARTDNPANHPYVRTYDRGNRPQPGQQRPQYNDQQRQQAEQQRQQQIDQQRRQQMQQQSQQAEQQRQQQEQQRQQQLMNQRNQPQTDQQRPQQTDQQREQWRQQRQQQMDQQRQQQDQQRQQQAEQQRQQQMQQQRQQQEQQRQQQQTDQQREQWRQQRQQQDQQRQQQDQQRQQQAEQQRQQQMQQQRQQQEQQQRQQQEQQRQQQRQQQEQQRQQQRQQQEQQRQQQQPKQQEPHERPEHP